MISVFSVTAVLSLAASLLAKAAADFWLDDRVAILGKFAGLQYSTNPGIAFGLQLPDDVQLLVILLALVFVYIFALRSAKTTISRIGFGLVIGGALANVLDRISDGVVTDFFQIGTFPIFNVSDSCITIGTVLLLAEAFLLHHDSNH